MEEKQDTPATKSAQEQPAKEASASASTDKPTTVTPKKNSTTILAVVSVFLAALAGFFGVMWLTTFRAMSGMTESNLAAQVGQAETEKVSYQMPKEKPVSEIIDLPAPEISSPDSLSQSVSQAVQNRRSRREYADEPVTLFQLSQILWSGQGVTDDAGHRAAPSAKGAYPYTLYVVVRDVEGVEAGLYQYLPDNHQLGSLSLANAGALLTEAGVQENAQSAPVVIVMAAAKSKMVEVFPDSNPDKNTYLEGGHIGQNIYLMVESLGMSTVVTGGFNPVAIGEALQLDAAEEVVYLIPVGQRVSEIE